MLVADSLECPSLRRYYSIEAKPICNTWGKWHLLVDNMHMVSATIYVYTHLLCYHSIKWTYLL